MKILKLSMFVSLAMIVSAIDGKAVRNTLKTSHGPAIKTIALQNKTNKTVELDITRMPNKDEMIDMSVVHVVLKPKERIAKVEIPFGKSYNIQATFAETIHYRAENQSINPSDLIKITSDKLGYYIEDYSQAGNMNWTTKRTVQK